MLGAYIGAATIALFRLRFLICAGTYLLHAASDHAIFWVMPFRSRGWWTNTSPMNFQCSDF